MFPAPALILGICVSLVLFGSLLWVILGYWTVADQDGGLVLVSNRCNECASWPKGDSCIPRPRNIFISRLLFSLRCPNLGWKSCYSTLRDPNTGPWELGRSTPLLSVVWSGADCAESKSNQNEMRLRLRILLLPLIAARFIEDPYCLQVSCAGPTVNVGCWDVMQTPLLLNDIANNGFFGAKPALHPLLTSTSFDDANLHPEYPCGEYWWESLKQDYIETFGEQMQTSSSYMTWCPRADPAVANRFNTLWKDKLATRRLWCLDQFDTGDGGKGNIYQCTVPPVYWEILASEEYYPCRAGPSPGEENFRCPLLALYGVMNQLLSAYAECAAEPSCTTPTQQLTILRDYMSDWPDVIQQRAELLESLMDMVQRSLLMPLIVVNHQPIGRTSARPDEDGLVFLYTHFGKSLTQPIYNRLRQSHEHQTNVIFPVFFPMMKTRYRGDPDPRETSDYRTDPGSLFWFKASSTEGDAHYLSCLNAGYPGEWPTPEVTGKDPEYEITFPPFTFAAKIKSLQTVGQRQHTYPAPIGEQTFYGVAIELEPYVPPNFICGRTWTTCQAMEDPPQCDMSAAFNARLHSVQYLTKQQGVWELTALPDGTAPLPCCIVGS